MLSKLQKGVAAGQARLPVCHHAVEALGELAAQVEKSHGTSAVSLFLQCSARRLDIWTEHTASSTAHIQSDSKTGGQKD